MRTIVMLSATIFLAGSTRAGQPAGTAPAARTGSHARGRSHHGAGGMTAGPPQDCVVQSELAENQAYGSDVILFRSRTGDVMYVNRLVARCPGLDLGLALRTHNTSARLCRGDTVTVVDPRNGSAYGSCPLGVFTPYRRAQ